jgi:hypothetical protein
MELFDKEHRDPNALPAGAGGTARNPTLPPNVRDENILNGLDPNTQATLKQLVDYKYPLPSGIALSKPYWQNLLGRAAQYDPSFDASQYQIRYNLRKDFTSGKSAQAIQALNQVTDHLDRLETNWKKLNNAGGLATPLNAPVNAVESFFGDPRRNTFELDQKAVADELERVWRQAGGTESEIADWRAKLSASASPATRDAAMREVYALVAGRLDALKHAYEAGMGRPAEFNFLDPAPKKRFEAHGVDTSGIANVGAAYNVGQQPAQPAPASGNAGNAPAGPAGGPAAPPKGVTDPLPPGDHTFRNGQTWHKNQDGTVTFVRNGQK